MKSVLVLPLFALLSTACLTPATVIHGQYEFSWLSASSDGGDVPFETESGTLVTRAFGVSVAARPRTNGVARVALQNDGLEPIVIDWSKSRFRVKSRQGVLIDSRITPSENTALDRNEVINRAEVEVIPPGATLVRSLTPMDQWYPFSWRESSGSYVYYYKRAEMRPILIEKQTIPGTPNPASLLANIEARIGDELSLALNVTRGSETRVISLDFVVSKAHASSVELSL